MSNPRFTAYYDIGTTNMRIFLLDETLQLLTTSRTTMGAKDAAIASTNRVLLEAMQSLYQEVLSSQGATDDDVCAIYASGMATSRDGICLVPHIASPITVDSFAQSGVTTYHDDTVFNRDIHLIAGLKTMGDTLSETNNCRGEEIEVLGVMDELEARYPNQQVAVIMPGSHTHVLLAGQGQLTGILSNFTGELFHALQTQTILAPILTTDSDHPDPEAVALAMENLRRYGFNRAIYIGHSMRVFDVTTAHFRRCYCEAVISGGVIQSLDAYCKEQWAGCTSALVVANPYICELFSLLLSHSQEIQQYTTIQLTNQKSYGLEGLRKVIALRKEVQV